MSLRVLVCGGRDFQDEAWLFSVLDDINERYGISEIIEGGAKGADTLALAWTVVRCVARRRFDADWTKHGKAAGPIRNARMLTEGQPDMVVAFPGGKGTQNMTDLAKRARVQVITPTRPTRDKAQLENSEQREAP